MQVSIKGLMIRLDSLRARINDLLDCLDVLEKPEDVEQYFQNDDTFNLSIALDVLEQADKLDKALEIIKSFEIISVYKERETYYLNVNGMGIEIIKEQYDLLKEVLL